MQRQCNVLIVADTSAYPAIASSITSFPLVLLISITCDSIQPGLLSGGALVDTVLSLCVNHRCSSVTYNLLTEATRTELVFQGTDWDS